MKGQMKIFRWVRGNSGNCSESCSENCRFRIDQVVRGHSENGISYSENGISNSESCSENTPELSQSSENGLSAPRAFFLKSGWFPGFWIKKWLPKLDITIDTETKAKRNNIISELITFRITKAKAKNKFGVRYLCGPECEKSSVPININTKA